MKMLVLLLVSLCLANNSIPDQLRAKIPLSDYNSQLIDMLELNLQGGQIDKVIELLQQMIGDLQGEQKVAAQEQSNRDTQFTSNIEALEKNLAQLNQEVQSANQIIGDSTEVIASLSQTSASLTKQFSLINTREESIRKVRIDETAALKKRGQSNARILDAIKTIHDKLANAVLNNGSFLEMEDKLVLVQQLKSELGERNPLALLVELTSKFDEQTARKVIEKLEHIQASIADSEQNDENNEIAANNNYQAILNEIESIRDKLSVESVKVKNLLKTKTNDVIVAKRRLDELSTDQANTEQLLQTNRLQQEQFAANFNQNSSSRSAQLSTLNAALQLIQENADRLRK